MELPSSISAYLESVCATGGEITSAWIIGSRANGTAKESSDWDILLFGSQQALENLAAEHKLRRADVDLLVVFNGNDFRSPWDRSDVPGVYKSGHLFWKTEMLGGLDFSHGGWEWREVSSMEAEYVGSKKGERVLQRAVKILRP